LSLCITFYLHHDDRYWFFVPCIGLGLGSATVMVVSVQLEADLLGQDTTSAAFVYGALSFTDKLSNGIAIFVLQALNDKR
jgi:Na+/melibiose symporter-like transporter